MPAAVDAELPTRVLADAATVREECGGVSRPTLLVWRREKDFPAPVRAPGVACELWDLREVRRWFRRMYPDAD